MTQPTDSQSLPRPWSQADWWLLVLVVCAAFGLYYQTHAFTFINYDDQLYASENRRVLSGLSVDNLKWATTAIVVANWHPLTMYTLLLVGTISNSAGAFHIANAILHTATTGLLLVFLRQATGRTWAAAFAAALWGLHPLRVESVAWVSELKDVLCGVFSILTLIAYTRFSRRPTAGRYAAVVAVFAMALLAKPMAVTLPAVLLLLDYWPLARRAGWGRLVVEKLPLLALSVADVWYAIVTQQQTASIGSRANFPMESRYINAVVSTTAYVRDTVWPTGLGLFYPHPAMLASPNAKPSPVAVAVSLVVLIGITVAAIAVVRRHRYLIIGWLWFLGMLTPVIGLLQIGEQSRADRYTYLPSIGLTVAVVWLVADLCRKETARVVAATLGGIVVVALSIVTYVDVGHWHDNGTVFNHAAAVIPNNYLALAEKADVLRSEGRVDESLTVGLAGVTVAPRSTAVHTSYGMALYDARRYGNARDELVLATTIDPHNAVAWDALGDAFHKLSLQAQDLKSPKVKTFRDAAITCYTRALWIDPEASLAEDHLAVELARDGRLDDAISHLRSVTNGNPRLGIAHGHLADALRVKRQYREALDHYAIAYAAGERDADWESYLAAMTSMNPDATPELCRRMVVVARDAVRQTNGDDADALNALAVSLARATQFDEAVSVGDRAVAVAAAKGDAAKADEFRRRVATYRSGKPYVVGDK